MNDVFGFTKESIMHPISVKAVLKDGNPAAFALVTIYNAFDFKGFTNDFFGSSLDKEGEVSLRVPKGTYNIIA